MNITVSQLFRYPVKSMRGESHTRLTVTERGVTGDRVWAVRDEQRGGIRGAKKIPSLMRLSAHFTGRVNDTRDGECGYQRVAEFKAGPFGIALAAATGGCTGSLPARRPGS